MHYCIKEFLIAPHHSSTSSTAWKFFERVAILEPSRSNANFKLPLLAKMQKFQDRQTFAARKWQAKKNATSSQLYAQRTNRQYTIGRSLATPFLNVRSELTNWARILFLCLLEADHLSLIMLRPG